MVHEEREGPCPWRGEVGESDSCTGRSRGRAFGPGGPSYRLGSH